MKKHFYSGSITFEKITIELDSMDLSDNEKKELISLASDSVYHGVLDVIMSEMGHEDKKVFLRLLATEDHPTVWRHLNKKVQHAEKKIIQRANQIIDELFKDIEELKASATKKE